MFKQLEVFCQQAHQDLRVNKVNQSEITVAEKVT